MKVSIITAVINSAKTIEGCIQSVLSQSHKDVEHIIIDGASWDGTLDIIGKYKDKIAGVVSEPDNGIYDALNKGISLASGDIVGFLHAGDFYAHNKVLETVVDVFKKQNVDSCYGDIQYVDKNNTDRVIRYWKSSKITPQGFIRGWMPPHPSFFVRLWVYKKYGFFKAEFKIAADYEIMLRFLYKYKISSYYLPEVLVKMRMGGLSNRNLKNILLKTREDYRAWEANGLKMRFSTIIIKKFLKIPQFLLR